MNWPESLAIIGVSWAVMSIPLAILIRNYKINRLMIEFKDKHPDTNILWLAQRYGSPW